MSFLPPFYSFLFKKKGCRPLRSAVNHCVIPQVSFKASKNVPKRVGGALLDGKILNNNEVTSSQMFSSAYWSLRNHDVIFAHTVTR